MRAALTMRFVDKGLSLGRTSGPTKNPLPADHPWSFANLERPTTWLAQDLRRLHLLKSGPAYYVVWSEGVHRPLDSRIVDGAQACEITLHGRTDFVLIVNLDQLEQEMLELFPELSVSEG
jgi:hypothetical protein